MWGVIYVLFFSLLIINCETLVDDKTDNQRVQELEKELKETKVKIKPSKKCHLL